MVVRYLIEWRLVCVGVAQEAAWAPQRTPAPDPAPGNRDIALEKVAARGLALASWLGTLGMQTGN